MNQKILALWLGLACFAPLAHAQTTPGTATMTVQVNQPGTVVSSNLFGIFFEEINYAGEGGLYGEMVRNRTINTTNFWTLVTSGTATGTLAMDPSQPLNTNLINSLNLTMTSGTGTVGAANSGFWGMSLKSGATYDLNFYACASNVTSVTALLESSNGTVYAQTAFSGLTPGWQHFAASLVSSTTDTNARLVMSISHTGTVWLDVVSLFPRATYLGRTNGMRADLAGMLADMNPSFLRFPGGNYIESYNVTNAVRWKTTVGDLANRPGHLNDAWGYWSTDGLGADEFFQFCQDLHMQPLYGLYAGLSLNYSGSTNNTVPIDQMGPYVQDALDLVQYANGDAGTTWGAQRIANGHVQPYNLGLMEIGNENGGSYYDARYALFYDSLSSNYPAVKMISPVWGATPTSRPVQIRDEHYYSDPSTFIGYATKYDSYSRTGPKVFVGEYAVTSGYGTYGNLSAALGEAAFMTGMERNSDIVLMASYAPLFANVNGIQWQPNLIYYNSSQAFGTPSYYVQKLFSQNRGNAVLPTTVTIVSNGGAAAPHGGIGLGSWNTAVQYTNIVVTSNGVTLYQSDFVNQGTNGWNVFNGTWNVSGGLYQQTAQITDCYATTGNTNWANYTLSLQARKTAGSEGFLILFNVLDNYDLTWWNIGGWNNTEDAVEQMVGGSTTAYTKTAQTISNNVWYYIRLVVNGQNVQCYLGTNAVQAATNLVQNITLSPAITTGLLASSTYSKSSGQVIIKAVNPYNGPVTTTFNLAGVNLMATNATLIQLTSANAAAENSLASPTNVWPVTNTFAIAGTNFSLTLPAYSLSVLRLNALDVNNYTNLLLSLPSVITNGMSVAASVWGQQGGTAVNLTTNSTYCITWSSSNTNVATVDSYGNITSIASGVTTITASYPALGLAASQSLQVVYVPVALVHRYAFSETSGTTIADSVGGAVWNGTLPRGGTFSGSGQLTLSSNSQQYVQLPGGILSNYTAVTLETWVTFPDQIANNCFFYGFGTYSGGTGYNYIFCAPGGGRAAMTSGNWSSEQNAYTGVDFSYHTNFHLDFVYNPPAGYLAIYTNGTVAARANLTIGFTTVSNVYSWIGRSLYSGDPYPDLILNEFRIYNGALSASDIAATDVLGPDQLLSSTNPVVFSSYSNGSLCLTWPLSSSGFTVLTSTNLTSGVWTAAPAAPWITNGVWEVILSPSNNTSFYRLTK